MKYKTLGRSGLEVSEVGFGCMSLGEDRAVNKALLHQALDSGITFFDTADLYQKGENEVAVGNAFKGMRDRVVLATKVGNQWRPDGSGWDWNPTKAYILQAVEHSLKRLQTDHIDLYQLHGGTIEDPIDETIEAFEILKAQGKIRAYGISSIRPNVIREYIKRSNIDSVMMQYSLLDRRPEEACLGLLQEQGIGVLARGSLAQGLLVGKSPKPYLGHSEKEVAAAAEAVSRVAGNQRSVAEVAARYVLHHPAVTTAVLGIRTAAQLQDALHVAEAAPLQEQGIEELKRAVQALRYEQHR
ncbi:aldo/keto reductase [Pontibacter saemangeumensis]|uniref:Aldo/keto reductase n=1 Tax=Pontibacter saemangeumensis TaxID=1084525 RepID=A0ABP8LUS3_9BACT